MRPVTFNHGVEGSSPSALTNFLHKTCTFRTSHLEICAGGWQDLRSGWQTPVPELFRHRGGSVLAAPGSGQILGGPAKPLRNEIAPTGETASSRLGRRAAGRRPLASASPEAPVTDLSSR